jgi:Tfp pilus assembly protein PilF
MNCRTLVFQLVLLIGFSTSIQADERIPIDQVPMYGGMDRNAIPELKAGDEKLIADTTSHYGTREKASAAFVNNGFAYYQRDDLANAMRRFNQAWLLAPMNAEVYAGFGSVLHDQGKNCEAMHMMEKAIALNPPTNQGIYPDAARVVALCAVSDKSLSPEAKEKLLGRSEALYKKAEEIEPNKPYVYGSWATAYYWRGQYVEAWSMVAKERAVGGKPSERFLGLLQEKTPEPTQKEK